MSFISWLCQDLVDAIFTCPTPRQWTPVITTVLPQPYPYCQRHPLLGMFLPIKLAEWVAKNLTAIFMRSVHGCRTLASPCLELKKFQLQKQRGFSRKSRSETCRRAWETRKASKLAADEIWQTYTLILPVLPICWIKHAVSTLFSCPLPCECSVHVNSVAWLQYHHLYALYCWKTLISEAQTYSIYVLGIYLGYTIDVLKRI